MNLETTNKILQETEQGYDLMAEKFSQTRKFFWRGLEFIGDYAKDGDRVLDFGCGNGRLLELFADKKIEYVGVDVSQKLLNSAKNRYAGERVSFLKINPSPRTKATNERGMNNENLSTEEVYLNQGDSQRLVRGGQVTLPFPDNYFNAAYSIAVFHHLPKAHAAKMAQELYRITKPGGHVVVTAWNLWQKNYRKNIFQNWRDKIMGKSNLGWNDCYITFKNNQGAVFQRFHHAFTRRELRKVFFAAGFRPEKCEIMSQRNILFVGNK